MDKLFYLISLWEFFTVLDQTDDGGVVNILQELWGAEGEKQWAEDTPLGGGTSADGLGTGYDAPQPHLLLPVSQKAGDLLIQELWAEWASSGGFQEWWWCESKNKILRRELR